MSAVEGGQDGYRFIILELEHLRFGLIANNGGRAIAMKGAGAGLVIQHSPVSEQSFGAIRACRFSFAFPSFFPWPLFSRSVAMKSRAQQNALGGTSSAALFGCVRPAMGTRVIFALL